MSEWRTDLPVRLLLLGLFIALSGAVIFASQLIPHDMTIAPVLIETGASETETEPEETLPEITGNPILISELMAVNRATLQTADDQFPDWIELYNRGAAAVNLEGYYLYDRIDNPTGWTFPAVIIEPGEHLVIYASGLGDNAGIHADDEIHTNFRLSGNGEEIIFSDASGHVLTYFEFPALPADMSFGLLDDADNAHAPYFYLSDPSPGQPNGLIGHASAEEARPVPVYSLRINEYIMNNLSLPDIDGHLSDWAELYNAGNQPLELAGFGFSDNPDNLFKWTFPEIIINPGEYLLVWLSGKDIEYRQDEPATLHASFALGSDDEALLITDPRGNPVTFEPLQDLPANVSYGRSLAEPDTWLFFPRPTPGESNSTAGFAALDDALSLASRGLWINEVSAISSERLRGETIRQADWIELYNGSGQPIDLEGYGLSDQQANLYRQTLSGKVIEPGEFLVIEPDAFGLSASGETIWLSAPDYDLIDWLDTGDMRNGLSRGRGIDPEIESADQAYYYEEPTPGQANTTPPLDGQAIKPFIQAINAADGQPHLDLYFDRQLEIHLSSPQPDAVIRYTLDGSRPDENAVIYNSPLLIDKNTVIRCYSSVAGTLPSTSVSRTWLTGVRHDLPVMSLQIDPQHFYDPAVGVYANFAARLEQQADFQFYEADGRMGIDFTAGLTLHGSFSRREAQKSMEIRLRALYGADQITYPFFPDNPVINHRRLILRTSGQDWKISKLRDAFMTNVIKEHTAQDTMDVRSCVLYVNGEYFGLYEIREKVNKHFMETHHGADPDNVDVIKGNRIVLSGDMQAYDALMRYVRNNDLRDPVHYDYVLSQIDEDSLMDFLITQSFFSNPDSGNKKFWREKSEDGQWRWVFFDLDWGLFPTTYTLNLLRGDLLHPEGHGHARIFSTTLQVRLMTNPDFRQRFIERYAWYLNHVFLTGRMLDILDSMTEDIRSEMPRQIERWGVPESMERWEFNVSELRRIVTEKRAHGLVILQDTFNLSDAEMETLIEDDR